MIYNNEKWDRRFLDVARLVSGWSKDPSSQIGAVCVRHGHIVGTGFNGFPKGVDDSEDRYNDRELKYKLVVHAEANALIQAGDRARGGTLYVYPGWGVPCMCSSCAKTAIQFGIVRVVGLIREQDKEKPARWKEELEAAREMVFEAGLMVDTYNE